MKKSRIKKKVGSQKSLSRLMAVQIFYQHDFFFDKRELEEIKNDVIENYALEEEENITSYRKKIDEDLLNNLVFGLPKDLAKIDAEITEFLNEGRNLKDLDNVMLQILRLAVLEMKFFRDVPTNVIIDEYVGIAASFFDKSRVTFVNAILDSLTKRLRS